MPFTTNAMERELKKQEKAKREEKLREAETLRKKEAEEAAAKASKEAAEVKAKLDIEWKEKQRKFFGHYRRAKAAEPKVIADEEVFANRHGLIINRSVLAATYQSTVYPAKRVAPKIGSPAPQSEQPEDPAESSMVVRVTVLDKCYTDYRKQLLAESLKLIKFLGTPEPSSNAASQTAQPAGQIIALRHPALVRVFDTFITEKKAYIFMEQLSTISLSSRIKTDAGLSLDDTQTFGRQICDALNFLNRLGLAHLNVRSDNILWNEQKQMKLSGPSRLFIYWDADLEVKIPHPRINNFNYMDHFPPEVVVKGDDFDAGLVDVYSFAALLHQMLAREKLFVRHMPFHGTENTKELWEGHLVERKDKLKRIPESAMALLKQIIPAKPEERPSLQQVLESAFFSATQEAIEAEISAPKVSQ